MTSSSEDSDGERMRLQEAVTGIPVKPKQGPSKKKRPSKRETATVEDDICSKLVSTDMQTFLAKKLSKHLDSVYELVSPSHTTCESILVPETSCSDATKTRTSAVRLFHDSSQPVTLDKQHTTDVEKQAKESASKICLKRKRKEPPSDSDSSESDSEVARLREAALDAFSLAQLQQPR